LLPNQGVQLTPLARPWAGRDLPGQYAPSCWRHDILFYAALDYLASQRPMRSVLLAPRHPPTFRRARQPKGAGAPQGGRTRIAWQLPRAAVLHPAHARQRRS